MATKKPKGLGRGLDALLEQNHDNDRANLRDLDIDALQPGKYQPRTRMDPGAIEELAASIGARGMMQPIIVRALDNSRFEIIAGERRWRAARQAALTQVPCIVREIPDEAALVLSLIENIQREDLNPLEEAAGLARLIEEFGMTHQQAAEAVGRSRPAASNLLRLLNLPPVVQELLLGGDIDMGHARALLALDKASQIELAHQFAARNLSVREAERIVQRRLNPSVTQPPKQADRDIINLEEQLSERFAAHVKIHANRSGSGQMRIHFSSLDELDSILKKIN